MPEGLEEADLRSGSRKRKVSRARQRLGPTAVQRLGDGGAAVARFLGMTPSAVNPLGVPNELPDLDRFI